MSSHGEFFTSIDSSDAHCLHHLPRVAPTVLNDGFNDVHPSPAHRGWVTSIDSSDAHCLHHLPRVAPTVLNDGFNDVHPSPAHRRLMTSIMLSWSRWTPQATALLPSGAYLACLEHPTVLHVTMMTLWAHICPS
jgi:hypothetical protein